MIIEGNETVAWFEDNGNGPAEVDLTVHVFENWPNSVPSVGLRFDGRGGPLLTADQAERIAQNMLLAVRMAREGSANKKGEG